jgi:purine-nucleoside phosphorylase
MATYRAQVEQATDFIKSHIQAAPRIGLLTGTGLSESVAALAVAQSFDYGELAHFPVSTVQSHPGRLAFGILEACPMVVMQGRFHLYEGYSPRQVTFPIRVMQTLGVKLLFVTNAAGGLDPTFSPGDLMVITDHLNLTGENPLVGPNENDWGPRFPDMGRAYDPKLAQIALHEAAAAGIVARGGVYAGLRGPSLETPAEIRYLQGIGAHAVGFSTIQEVIAAVHGGMRVLGLSVITNVHDPEAPVPATEKDIIDMARAASPKLGVLIRNIVRNPDAQSR